MTSARDKLREYFENNVGKTLEAEELFEVAGISEWARRIRELRDDEGMQILSSNDRNDLKPGQYVLTSLERTPRISHAIDARLRTRILERNGYTCQTCGAGAGDPDYRNSRRKVRLHVDHIDPNGPSESSNLRVLCSVCNEGRSNLSLGRSTINLLAAVRKANRADQEIVYEWLKMKFGNAI